MTAWLLALFMIVPQSVRPAEADRPCGECKTTGKFPYELPKSFVELEAGCTWCSEVVEDKGDNYGVAWQPCPKCHSPSLQQKAQVEYDAFVKDGRAWLAKRREIDDFLADPKDLHLMHVMTPHFDLAWAVPKVKVGKQIFNQHESMHLYARRLEEDYATYLEHFGFDHVKDQNSVRHEIMVFDTSKHANKAQPKYCGMGGTGITDGAKLMGSTSVFVTWWNKTKNRDDDEFHENLLHNISHLFLASCYNYKWLARKNGWIDEGLSHYFTDKKFKLCRTHCFQEQDEASNWVHPPWRPEVRKRVAADKIPVFAETATKHGENLTSEEHLFVWSWVEYLNEAYEPAKFVKLIRGLKDDVPLRNLFQDIYGLSPFQFIDEWKKYVLEKYPPR